MTLRALFLGALATLSCVAASPAAAWSVFGHELIAELAERQLSDQARAGALAMLAGEADHLADVAGWADPLRDEPAYAWATPLHYVNFPRGECHFDAIRDCPAGACVVGAVQRFQSDLADASLPAARRAEALKFLIHFVGDLHQPLHCGYGDDKGGNTYQVNLAGDGSNLHRIWDYSMLASSGRDRAGHLAALSAQPLPAAGAFDPAGWAEESCRIVASEGFYPRRRRLEDAYFERFRPIAEQRMRLAAARLAALLERQFGAAQ
jgi:hypothetical protein